MSKFQLPEAHMFRRALKRFIYSQLTLRESLLIGFGRSKPLVSFRVEADPPSVYLNFRTIEEFRVALDEIEAHDGE